MKNVNLIQTLSPKKQFEIRRWFLLSTLLSLITLIIISFFTYLQLSTLHTTQKEIDTLREKAKQYDEEINNKNKLTHELETLQSKKNKIDQFIHTPKNPHSTLADLTSACGSSITILDVCLNNKILELSALCDSPEHATVFMQRLATFKQFSGLKLASLGLEQSTRFKIVVKGPIP